MDQSEFSRIFCERPQSFAWFLGAGSSRNANLPTAEDIITDLKLRYYCSEENQEFSTKDMQNDAVRVLIESFFKSRGFPERWSPNEYSKYFETIFGADRERQRKYIRAMLSEKRVRLAVGNRAMGALIASGIARAIFTTNFDSVVEKSVAEFGGSTISAYHLEGAKNANAALNGEEYPFYCKIHGDFRYDSIKNLSTDLADQNDDLADSFVNASNRFGLIVIGYSGRDESVMSLFHKALNASNPFPHGLYWAKIKGSPPLQSVSDLIDSARDKGVNAEIVEIDTFDTFMLRLWRNLPERPEGYDEKVRQGRVEDVSIPLPPVGSHKPLIRMNALPILDAPNVCLKVTLKRQPTWITVGSTLREAEHNLVTSVGDELMVWGDPDEVRSTFSDGFVALDEYEFDPNWNKSGRLHVKRFLEDALGKGFARERPLLMRRRGTGIFLIVDKMDQDVGAFDKLHSITGKTTGTIPDLTIAATDTRKAVERIDFAEAVRISLTYADDKLWMLMKPDVWIWPSFARQYASNWLDKRKSDRRNDKHDSLLSAWVGILSDQAGQAEQVKISSYEAPKSASNPEFSFSTRTGFTKKRGQA